jgi:uncharacterized protein YecE (DUF72 family)
MTRASPRAAPFGHIRIGTSGYQYAHWRGRFYPAKLPQREWLAFYAAHFDTVEINATFYRLPDASTFERWRDVAPEGFTYALKFSRYGSHLKHLREPEESIGQFLERAERLGERLGPILVQLPPRWRVDAQRLESFLANAPRRHRWAVEFRDPSWLRDDVLAILHDHGAALCIHDLIPDHPVRATADWVYVRFHGHVAGRRYGARRLMLAVHVIERFLEEGRDVFAYFNNDFRGYAVRDALQLERLLGASPPALRRGPDPEPRA